MNDVLNALALAQTCDKYLLLPSNDERPLLARSGSGLAGVIRSKSNKRKHLKSQDVYMTAHS